MTERSAVIDIVYDRRLSANTQWYIEYELWSTGRKSYLTLPADVASVTLKSLTPGRLYTVRAYGRSTGGVQSSRSTDEVTFTTSKSGRTTTRTHVLKSLPPETLYYPPVPFLGQFASINTRKIARTHTRTHTHAHTHTRRSV